MPRGGNPFYHQDDEALGAALGAKLGTALFGDPEARAQLQLRQAQMANYAASAREADAHAGLYGAQTDGVGIQNTASRGLPEAIANLFPHTAPVAAPAASADPLAPLPEAAPAEPAFDPVTFRAGLPAALATMAQMQGDKVDPAKILGTVTALTGNDEFARRGMVANQVTPGENFALTDDRADDIRKQGFDATYHKDTDVASINHANDVPVAMANHANDVRVALANHSNDIPVARINHANDTTSGGRTGGWSPRSSVGGDNSDGDVDGKEAVMSQRLGIGVDAKIGRDKLPLVFDAIAATEGGNGSLADRNNNPGNIRDGAFARNQPGYAGPGEGGYARFVSRDAGRQAGIALLGTYHSRGQQSIRDIVEGLPPPGKTPEAKAPTQVSAADLTMIDNEIAHHLGDADHSAVNKGARDATRIRAVQIFQQTGNAVGAVVQAIKDVTDIGHRKLVAASKPPVAGARKAPDGHWYVKQGSGYLRVDVQ